MSNIFIGTPAYDMHKNIYGYIFDIIDDGNIKFWRMLGNKQWESFTYECIKNNPGNMFWDIGGWIGPISLFASKFFNKVITWEPDNIAYEKIINNIRNNNIDNIEVNKLGIYKEKTTLSFGIGHTIRGGSTSSINHSNNTDGLFIETTTIDECLKQYGFPDFVKMDIEGGEEYLIDDLIKYKFPNIHLSNHFDFIKDIDLYKKKLKELEKLYVIFNEYYTNKVESINDGASYLKLRK